METEYLKTKEDIATVRVALSTARSLESAEKKLEEMRPAFRQASQKIIETIGIELWHTDSTGGKFFWKYGGKESIYYESRVSALRALLDENITWKK
jgi:hypothetical protein